jgi:protein-S-isoprenylcysteine O-methyltransferase Ste14
MSHRTRHLPPETGILSSVRELRYHEASRQGLGVILLLLLALTARPTAWLAAIGLAMALVGIVVRLYASGYIMKNEQLAKNGPYALVRHPLYTGNILILLGFALAHGTWWAYVAAGLFFWFYYPCAIDYEDHKLKRLFGEEWERWAANVPALIPTFANLGAARGGSWSLAKSSKRNGELIVAAYCLLCMGIVVWRIG